MKHRCFYDKIMNKGYEQKLIFLQKVFSYIGKENFMNKRNQKRPPETLISTILLSIYTLLLLCIEIGIIIFSKYAEKITDAGTSLAARTQTMTDYISGYLILPGSFATLFGSVSGIVAIILAVGILILFFLFLITLIISCILVKKKKILADAWMKLIIFLILTCISALFIQVAEITVLMIIPVILAGIVLIKLYVHK